MQPVNSFLIHLLNLVEIQAFCPMHDATEGLDGTARIGTTAFSNVIGTNGTGIHNAELPVNITLSTHESYSSSNGSGTGLDGCGYNENSIAVNCAGHTGNRQHALPGFHSLDYDLFGAGTLNHSYSKNIDGSFYGRSDDDPFINSLIGGWRRGSNFMSSGLIENNKSSLKGTDGAGGALAVGNVPPNGGGKEAETLAAQKLGGAVGRLSASGATGKTFKFNQRSLEATLSDYTRFFTASKIYAFNPTLDGLYKIVLVSTTKEYHPQMKILEINKSGGEKYVEKFGHDKENGMYSTRYSLRKDREYLVEIGASEKLDFSPFANINTGGFICIISAEKKSLQEILGQHDFRVSIFGKVGRVPILQNEVLELASVSGKKEGAGMLNYSVTPFFNENIGSITIFFHKESTFSNDLSSTAKEASVVEFECHLTSNPTRVFEGVEASQRIIEFNIQSRNVCDLVDMLK